MVRLLEFKNDAKWIKSNGHQVAVAYLVLEFVQGGELCDFALLEAFSEPVCRFYFKQMLQVMHYVHTEGVAHRDLKLENILLDSDFNLKIADFGFAAPVQGRDGTGFLNTILGTINYMAPEILLREPYQQTISQNFSHLFSSR